VAYFVWVGATVAATLLTVAGIQHLAHPRRTAEVLTRQGTLPSSLARRLPLFLGLAESGCGTIGLLTTLSRLAAEAPPSDAIWLPVGALYTTYSLYALVLVRARPGAPCGCIADATPATLTTVLRAASLAVVSGVAYLSTTAVSVSTVEAVILLAAGVALSTLFWYLPQLVGSPVPTSLAQLGHP